MKVDTKKLLGLCEKVCKSQSIGNVHDFYEAAKPDVVRSLCAELERAYELLELTVQTMTGVSEELQEGEGYYEASLELARRAKQVEAFLTGGEQ